MFDDQPGCVTTVEHDVATLVRRDQLDAVRQSVLHALPVSVLLAVASLAVAIHAGLWRAGLVWCAASAIVNLFRMLISRTRSIDLKPYPLGPSKETLARSVRLQLLVSCLAALLSGCVWACLPLLCNGYMSSQTMFYLTITCGITAGAVTYGTAFAAVPICFIIPPLLSIVGCLLSVGGFDRDCLAINVLLYLAALIKGTIATEAGFRETSRLKIEATALARSSEAAHASASALAEEMGRRATHDDLTGLLNRAGFAQDATVQLRSSGTAPCLMLLDLDGFKSVNDIYGHATGDRVLTEVARRVRAVLPERCIAARLGGDEFAVLYDPATLELEPAALARRLIGVVAEPFESFDAGRLGVSVGIHHAPDIDLSSMLSSADEALYAAKRAGRNRFQIFDDGLRRRLEMRRDCERDLSRALADGKLQVWFQPIFGQGGRALVGLEGLLRWHHPVHGWVPPGEVIALAALAGLTEPLLRFILDQACAMALRLHNEGRTDIRVAINVSPREMAQVAVDRIILDRIQTLSLSPEMFEIEITEETAVDINVVKERLLALTREGIRIALDDFGSGYSSLASLRQLQAGRIKIDRSLVTGLAAHQDKRAMVQGVLSLGHSLGLEVVAEGVETAEDLALLRHLNCAFMQGYHLSRPLPSHDALAMVLTPRATAA